VRRSTRPLSFFAAALGLASHAGRRGQHPMRADKIGPLAGGLARQLHLQVVVASDQLRG
jgi:hypothetical protein